MKRRTVTLLGLAALLVGGGMTLPVAHARRGGSTESNKTLVRRLMEGISKGNMAVVDETVAANFVGHGRNAPQGVEGVKQVVSELRTSFPDVQITVEDQIAEGDKVATRYSWRGTHTGKLGAVEPTGKQVSTTGILMARIAGGKIVDGWLETDTVGVLQQIGALPTPEAAR
jgi:predicted ester cyclase